MPPKNHTTEPAAEPGTSPIPGKPLSQVEAEAPLEGEAAEQYAAEIASRWPQQAAETGEAAGA
jgi:hypothetical protein